MLTGLFKVEEVQVVHLEFVPQGHYPGVEGELVTFLQGADDAALAGEQARGDREDNVWVEDRFGGLHLDQDVQSMVRLDEGQLGSATLLGLCEIPAPSDLIVLILMIEEVAGVHIILNYDFSSAVLKKFFPSGRYYF